MARVDNSGAAYAGSQLQTQLWVNRRVAQLDEALRRTIAGLDTAHLEWRSPLAANAHREYQDAAFLKAVGLGAHADDLATYWPARGPVWDGLAVVQVDGTTGVLLAEGKSYPGELYGGGCKAQPKSRERIEAALAKTQAWLGVDAPMTSWCGPLYQTANRLAHLYWFREVVGVPAWFVHLLFVDDPHAATTPTEWEAALAKADRTLGLPAVVPGAGHLLLAAGTFAELTDNRDS